MNSDRDTNDQESIRVPPMPRASAARMFFFWMPAVLWAALIITLTSLPGGGKPFITIPYSDLVAHCGFYGVLGFLLCRATFRGTPLGPTRKAAVLAYALGQAYGIADELHQMLIPTRFCTLDDMVADGTGVVLGIACYAWLARRRRLSR